MKTLLPVTFLFLSCMTTFAQINDPVWKQWDFKNSRKVGSVNVISAKSIESGNVEQKPAGQNPMPGITSSFNPAWANRLQTVLDSVMKANPTSKGASVAVYTPEEGMWTGVSGISYPGVSITPGMRFGIASNTKLFVAVAILKLQEEGVLTLDDHLNKWLPPIKNVDSNTTIRQLLTHQSGIYSVGVDLTTIDTIHFWSEQEILAQILKPYFSPGDGYKYSNTNYILAAMVIEAATGKTWVQKLHDLIFDPLKLDSTFVGAFEPRNGPVAAEWDSYRGRLLTNSPMTAEFSSSHAAGAIFSTASEMVQWYNALFNGSVISKTSLGMLLSFDPSSLYGLGITENDLNYSHSGEMFGYHSLIVFDIRRKGIICFLFNDLNNWAEKINPMIDVFFLGYPKRTNDAELTKVIAPWEHFCSNIITPKIELKNNGSSPLSSVSMNYKVDNGEILVFNWTGLLNPGKTTAVSLPSITSDEGSHEFTCYTTLPNGQPEGYSFNDTLRSTFYVNISTPAITELYEGFDGKGFPRGEGWTLNSSSVLQWGETSLTRFSGSGAGVVNNINRFGVIGQYRDLQLPMLNISNLKSTDFSFDYAYSPYLVNYQDSLQVSVSMDCGETWATLFYKGGSTLRTTNIYQQDIYYPKTNEWKHVSFPLSDFKGDILIRFRARYGNSNNLYIDNIRVGLPVGIDEFAVGGQQSAISVYPNPFSNYITIKYELDHSADVNLTIHNQLGQQVKNLVNEFQPTGGQQVEWNAEGLPAGIYYCRLKAGNQFITQKIVKM